ncbi:MAG: nucleotidyltransferase domain-containing protein [bacterium]|nr:nucleotidyltransferase domain-containing protein [bacterium]
MVETQRPIEELLRQGAAVLRAEGATDVYVFGSVASGRVHPRSDVDLAVAGLPPEKFFGMLSRLSELFARSVDLVDLDDENLFTSYLKRKGLLRRVA